MMARASLRMSCQTSEQATRLAWQATQNGSREKTMHRPPASSVRSASERDEISESASKRVREEAAAHKQCKLPDGLQRVSP